MPAMEPMLAWEVNDQVDADGRVAVELCSLAGGTRRRIPLGATLAAAAEAGSRHGGAHISPIVSMAELPAGES